MARMIYSRRQIVRTILTNQFHPGICPYTYLLLVVKTLVVILQRGEALLLAGLTLG